MACNQRYLTNITSKIEVHKYKTNNISYYSTNGTILALNVWSSHKINCRLLGLQNMSLTENSNQVFLPGLGGGCNRTYIFYSFSP